MAIEADKASLALAADLNGPWLVQWDLFDCAGFYYGQHDSPIGDGKCQ